MSQKLRYAGILFVLLCVVTVILVSRGKMVSKNENDSNPPPIEPKPKISQDTGPGRLEFLGPQERDLGVCKPDSSKKLVFEMRNVGGRPVRLKTGSCTCKCTVGGSSEASVKPNDKIAVALSWKTPSDGEFLHSGSIKTDVVEQSELQFIVRGKVGKTFVFDPPKISLGSFHSETETVVPALLLSREDEEFTFRTHRVVDEAFADKLLCESTPARRLEPDELSKYPDAKWIMELKLRLMPRIPFGEFNTEVQFTSLGTNGYEILPYPVSGKSLYPVSVLGGDNFDERQCLLNVGRHQVQNGLSKTFAIGLREVEGIRGNLTVASIEPASLKEILEVHVDPPKKSASRDLFPISLKISPSCPPIELTGRFENDFGKVIFNTGFSSNPQYTLFLKLKMESSR